MYSKEKVLKIVEKNKQELSELCEYIFDNPEKGFEEYKASAALKNYFRKAWIYC